MKATSVTVEGEEDGFVIEPGYRGEVDPRGSTRLVVSVPREDLPRVHRALLGVLEPPLGLLYRQKIDRRAPRPDGAPPRDFVALELPRGDLLDALEGAETLLYDDARAEIWVRGRHGDQVILDTDALVYAYPDDPAFRDVLTAAGVPVKRVTTMSERDYVKHWFRAQADAQEDALLGALGAAEVPHRK